MSDDRNVPRGYHTHVKEGVARGPRARTGAIAHLPQRVNHALVMDSTPEVPVDEWRETLRQQACEDGDLAWEPDRLWQQAIREAPEAYEHMRRNMRLAFRRPPDDDSGVREPRRPRPPEGSGTVAKTSPEDVSSST